MLLSFPFPVFFSCFFCFTSACFQEKKNNKKHKSLIQLVCSNKKHKQKEKERKTQKEQKNLREALPSVLVQRARNTTLYYFSH